MIKWFILLVWFIYLIFQLDVYPKDNYKFIDYYDKLQKKIVRLYLN